MYVTHVTLLPQIQQQLSERPIPNSTVPLPGSPPVLRECLGAELQKIITNQETPGQQIDTTFCYNDLKTIH